jgi:hypothetical protein
VSRAGGTTAKLLKEFDMTRLFSAKFYRHCPDCRQRMRRVVTVGDDIYRIELWYECPCGSCWTYMPYFNSMCRGLPKGGPR